MSILNKNDFISDKLQLGDYVTISNPWFEWRYWCNIDKHYPGILKITSIRDNINEEYPPCLDSYSGYNCGCIGDLKRGCLVPARSLTKLPNINTLSQSEINTILAILKV